MTRERRLVAAAVVVAVGVRLAYVLLTQDHALAGDEVEYDIEARYAADGRFLWTTTPYGEPHASTWKAPVYPALLGALYALVGPAPDRALVLQTLLLAPLTILATWQLGRRLAGPAVGVVAAFGVALYPGAWQYDVRLYSESVSTPLTTATLAVLVAAASRRSWALVGGLVGVGVLVRPSSVLLLAGVAVVAWARHGPRGGTARLLAVVAIAVAVVAPWSVRNALLPGPWVPVSVQSGAAYGVFNDDAAQDDEHRWAWRPLPRRDVDLFARERTDGELYRDLLGRAGDYVRENPGSVPRAFWANGVQRLWDLRSPSDALFEVQFEGRTRAVAAVALGAYWPLLALAVGGLVRLWRSGRRDVVLAVAALALASSVVYTTDGGTRYRAPLEPLVVVLAATALPRRAAS